MIIYNKTWLSNLLLIDLVEKEYEDGQITNHELAAIRERYTIGFYTPNFFIRVGLFLLTAAISFCTCGFLSLVFEHAIGPGWLVFLGSLNYAALHIMVKRNFHYRSGVDDALLWISFGLLCAAYSWAASASHFDSYLALSAFVFFLSLYLALRFADGIMSLVCYMAALGIIFFSWQKIGAWGISTMPFILMIFSGTVYLVIRRSLTASGTMFYSGCMVVLQAVSLVSLYASGNYYVVKELGNILHKTTGGSVTFGWFFWVWTIVLPLAYVYRGIWKKNVVLVRTGLLLCIAAALTFRYYYHLMPLEVVFILGGIVLLAVSWYLTNYLKTPKHGITCQELTGSTLADQLKIESLIISESASGIGKAPADNGTHMGGGKFGGGGASGGF